LKRVALPLPAFAEVSVPEIGVKQRLQVMKTVQLIPCQQNPDKCLLNQILCGSAIIFSELERPSKEPRILGCKHVLRTLAGVIAKMGWVHGSSLYIPATIQPNLS
jgi:hypothetical protein